jgi:hypothetical protein
VLEKLLDNITINDINKKELIQVEFPSSDNGIQVTLGKFSTELLDTLNIEVKNMQDNKRNKNNGFFPFINKSSIDLSHCSIYNTFNSENYRISCFHQVLLNSKLFTEEELNRIKNLIINEYIPRNKLNKIAKLLDVTFILQYRKGKRVDNQFKHYRQLGDIENKHYNKGYKTIKIGVIENHYFINNNNEFKIIEKLFKEDKFEPIDANNLDIYKTIFVNEIVEKNTKCNLKYSYKSCRKGNEDDIDVLLNDFLNSKNLDKPFYDNIIYSDYEASTDEEIHKSYMVCSVDQKGIQKIFTGINHTNNYLNYLAKQEGENILVYFHNLGYDYQFFIKNIKVIKIIKNASCVKEIKCIFRNKKLTFRDSYCLISSPLKDFNKMFGIVSKKSFLPHSIFNKINLYEHNGFIPVEEILRQIPKKNHDDIKPFIMDVEINLLAYASNYCINDCIVLKEGLEKFKKTILPLFDTNNLSNVTNQNIIDKCISTPSLVFNIMQANKNNLEGIYKFSHNIQKYLANFVIGGRVMCANNKKQYIKKNKQISSLDANSLYPSAFMRIKEIGGFLKGKPKILQDNELNMDFLNSIDGYFIRIKINRVNKTKPFPTLSVKSKSGIRNFTNDIINEIIYVDKFSLEDAIVHHGIEFDIIDGYYFNEGRNHEMCNLVEVLYNTRLKLKADKNPLENVYKLLLNSLYGKFIESDKNKMTNIDIIDQNKYENFIDNNYNRIKEFSIIGKNFNNEDIFLFKSRNIIDNHFNFQHMGCEILSMSKRIMNEVFDVANDNNIEIFYQDTDSLKMFTEDVQRLSQAFKTKYDKELLGKALSQFKDEYSDIYCNTFIATGKKFYYSNDLKGDKSKISSKGIPLELVLKYSDIDGKIIHPEELFTDLYDNKKITFSNKNFDKVMFKHNKDLTISNNKDFNRAVQFKD